MDIIYTQCRARMPKYVTLEALKKKEGSEKMLTQAHTHAHANTHTHTHTHSTPWSPLWRYVI